MGSAVLDRTLYGVKSDGVVAVVWVGGAVRFRQDLIASDIGTVSAQSIAKAGEHAIFFLGTDGVIYSITRRDGVQPLSHESLYKLLPDTMSLNRLSHARGMIDADEDTYYLFYDRTGLSLQLQNSYVSYNYRTQEWDKGEIGQSVISMVPYKEGDSKPTQLIVAADDELVYEFDSTAIDDNAVAIDRSWTTGWVGMEEVGYCHGMRLIFEKNAASRIVIDSAFDLEDNYKFKKEFSLKGGYGSDDYVEIEYQIPPRFVEWMNLRIRFYHTTTSAKTRLVRLGAVGTPVAQAGNIYSRRSART
jgi:hypothetical protein